MDGIGIAIVASVSSMCAAVAVMYRLSIRNSKKSKNSNGEVLGRLETKINELPKTFQAEIKGISKEINSMQKELSKNVERLDGRIDKAHERIDDILKE